MLYCIFFAQKLLFDKTNVDTPLFRYKTAQLDDAIYLL